MEINAVMLFSSSCELTFGQDLVLKMQESSTKVSSSTYQRLSMSLKLQFVVFPLCRHLCSKSAIAVICRIINFTFRTRNI